MNLRLSWLLAMLLPVVWACKGSDGTLRSGDLIFCVAQNSNMSDAIVDATHTADSVQYDHVAIYLTVNDTPMVIEAVPKYGVVTRPFADFMEDNQARISVRRVAKPIDIEAAIARARQFEGQPYDWSFRPDNGRMYCSELVYYSFLDSAGNPIFEAAPMNFRDASGNLPQFWIDLFNRLGEDVPEGIPGTNPNTMIADPALIEVSTHVK